VTLKVLRPVQVTNLSAWVQFVEQDELIQVPIQNGRSVQSKNFLLLMVFPKLFSIEVQLKSSLFNSISIAALSQEIRAEYLER
jgi:hypothetical protein